jgi:hypothetical protein
VIRVGSVHIKIYRANGNDSKWSDRAKTAFQDLSSSVNFGITYSSAGTADIKIESHHSKMLDTWADWLRENNVTLGENEICLLCVNELNANLGAGAVRGGAVGPKGYPVLGSDGCIAFVNAAVRFKNACYGNEPTYPPTCLHEILHATIHSGQDHVGESEHSNGEIRTSMDSCPVSPMQIWYAAVPCPGNDPPESNCNDTPDKSPTGVSHTPSDCMIQRSNEYMKSW